MTNRKKPRVLSPCYLILFFIAVFIWTAIALRIYSGLRWPLIMLGFTLIIGCSISYIRERLKKRRYRRGSQRLLHEFLRKPTKTAKDPQKLHWSKWQ